jgi:hypothetical protein
LKPGYEKTMSAEEGIGLNNEERLFPSGDSPCEQYQEHPISLRIGGSFDLTTKDDQLLTEHGVFGDKFRLAAGKIGERCAQEAATGWPRPLQNVVAELTTPASDLTREQGKQYRHSDLAPW